MNKPLVRKGWLSAGIIVLILILTLYLLLVGEIDLAIAFGVYALILIQSRLRLSRIIFGFPGAPTLRRLLRSVVFFLPLPFLGLPHERSMSWGIVAGLIYGALFILWRLPELRFNLSAEFISILPPVTREDRVREAFHPILGAVAQEYFYRGVMLYLLASRLGLWSVMIATLLFTAEHFMHFDALQAFDWKDYVLQTLLGLGVGVIFYFSGSLIGCILGHVVYNCPGAIQVLRRRLVPRYPVGEHGLF
ncbi:MAG TPA: CPBP family intramembrane glutamic endopeptidase [Anaerolineae bacterium]|nr:CPBP family intramembrane glutamic endopeptidase [Anaerolineae bacterium]